MTQATWIVLTAVVVGVALLAWATTSLLRRLRTLTLAAAGLRSRAEQAHVLQHQLHELEPRLVEMSRRLERITTQLGRR